MHYTKQLLMITVGLLPALALAGGDPDDLAAVEAAEVQGDVQAEVQEIQTDVQKAVAPQPVVADDVLVRDASGSDDVSRVLQVYASDKAAEFLYEYNGSVFGFDNSRATASVLVNEERDSTVMGQILFDADPTFLTGLDVVFGARALAGLLGTENRDIVALGAVIEAGYSLPVRQFPLRLSAGISYAPDIFTFGQSDRIIDYNVRVALPLTDTIVGFVGARFLQFDTRPGDDEVDNMVHLGIRWNLN